MLHPPFSRSVPNRHVKLFAGLFDIYDKDASGYIDFAELEMVLKKVGRDSTQGKTAENAHSLLPPRSAARVGRPCYMPAAPFPPAPAANELLGMVDPDKDGKLGFDEFLYLLSKGRPVETGADGLQADTKVVEFLRILDEYRIKCEDEGNYLEAERATKQLGTLRKQVWSSL